MLSAKLRRLLATALNPTALLIPLLTSCWKTSVWNWINPAPCKRVTASNPTQGKKTTSQETVLVKALHGVMGTSRVETTTCPDERRDENLPETTKENQDRDEQSFKQSERPEEQGFHWFPPINAYF